MSITLTQAAADQIHRFLSTRGKGIGLRLAVKKTGCSGLAYLVEFADELAENDRIFEDRGVKLVVDSKSLAYLDGTEVDFQREGLNESFRFRNPNVKEQCGCGESFSV